MALFSSNVQIGKPLKLSAWRKIAIGTWRTAADPSVYGILEVEAEPSLKYLEKLNAQGQGKVTLTHLVGRAYGLCFKHHPQLNCVLRWGRLYPRKHVDIFFQVANDGQGQDLSGVTVRRVDEKSIVEIAQEMNGEVVKVRHHGDPQFKKTKSTMNWMPGLFASCVLRILSFILYGLNIYSPLFGSPRDAFGSLMITNIGTLGLGVVFAPLLPFSRVPALIAVGAVREKPMVKNGQIVVAKTIEMGVTIDHRIIDGLRASIMAKEIQEYFKDPEKYL